MAYVTADEMVADSWVSLEAVKQKLPAVLANYRSKKAAGLQLVTREHTTRSKYVVAHPSSYVRYRESLPLLLEPVLQYYLQEGLTYSENRDLTKQ